MQVYDCGGGPGAVRRSAKPNGRGAAEQRPALGALAASAEAVRPSESTGPRVRHSHPVAERYQGACFYRAEGWWTYELCINKHVRQFRQSEEGTAEQETEGEDSGEQQFFLGMFEGRRREAGAGAGTGAGTGAGAGTGTADGSKGSTHGSHSGGAQTTAEDVGYAAHLHKHDPERSYASAQYAQGDACEVGPEWESDIARLAQSRSRETEVSTLPVPYNARTHTCTHLHTLAHTHTHTHTLCVSRCGSSARRTGATRC